MSKPAEQVLVTGSAGAVGRAVCRALLAAGYTVRGFDRHPTPLASSSVVADLTDAAAVDAAVAGTGVVIHLAAYPDDADFLRHLVPSNVIGLYHVMHAAHQHRVRRVVLASSIQVVSGLSVFERAATLADGYHPRNHYALTKVWAEEMGRLYADRFGLSVLALRLGWLPRSREDLMREKKRKEVNDIYLSHADAGRAFLRAVEAPDVRFAAVFVSSRHNPAIGMDPEPARQVLGFEAQDAWPDGCIFD